MKRLHVKRLHTITGVPMITYRIQTPAEDAAVKRWQDETAATIRTNDLLPEADRKAIAAAPLLDVDLEVPATVITLARRFIFESSPANIDEAVSAAALYAVLCAVPDTSKVLDIEDAHYDYLMSLVNGLVVQRYGVNAGNIIAAFTNLIAEPAADGASPRVRAPRATKTTTTKRAPARKSTKPTPIRAKR